MMIRTSLISIVFLSTVACGPSRPDCPENMVSNESLKGEDNLDDNDFAYQARCIDIFMASRIDATADDAGLDESFAVAQPGVIPWTNVTYGEAQRACLDAGKDLCHYPLTISSFCSYPEQENATEQVTQIHETGTWGIPEEDDEECAADWDLLPAWMENRLLTGRVSSRRAMLFAGSDDYDNTSLELVEDGWNPAYDPRFRSPLLGFRCCMRQVWADIMVEFNEPGTLMREELDPEVETYIAD